MKVDSAVVRIILWLGYAILGVCLWAKGSQMMDDTALEPSFRLFGGVLMYLALSAWILVACSISTDLKAVRQSIRAWLDTPVPSDYTRSPRLQELLEEPSPYADLADEANRLATARELSNPEEDAEQ